MVSIDIYFPNWPSGPFVQASTIFFETLFETLLHLFNEPPPPLCPFQITDFYKFTAHSRACVDHVWAADWKGSCWVQLWSRGSVLKPLCCAAARAEGPSYKSCWWPLLWAPAKQIHLWPCGADRVSVWHRARIFWIFWRRNSCSSAQDWD